MVKYEQCNGQFVLHSKEYTLYFKTLNISVKVYRLESTHTDVFFSNNLNIDMQNPMCLYLTFSFFLYTPPPPSLGVCSEWGGGGGGVPNTKDTPSGSAHCFYH